MLSLELYYEALASTGTRKSAFRRRKRKKSLIPGSKDSRDAWTLALLPEASSDGPPVFSFLHPEKNASAFFDDTHAPLKADSDGFGQPALGDGTSGLSSSFPFDNCGDLVALSRDSATYGSLRRSSTSSLSFSDLPGDDGARPSLGLQSPSLSKSSEAFSPLLQHAPWPSRDAEADEAAEHLRTTSSASILPPAALFNRVPDRRRRGPSRGVGGLYGQGGESEASRKSDRLSSHLSSLSRTSLGGKGTPDRLGLHDWRLVSAWGEDTLGRDGADEGRRSAGSARLSVLSSGGRGAVSAFLRDDEDVGSRKDHLLDDPFFDDRFFLPQEDSGGGPVEGRDTELAEARVARDASSLLALPWETGGREERDEGEQDRAARKRLKGEKQALRLTWDAREERLAFLTWKGRGARESEWRTSLDADLLSAAAKQAERIREDAEEREKSVFLHSRQKSLHPATWHTACCALHFEEELKKRREETEWAEKLATTGQGDSGGKASKKVNGAEEDDCLDPRDGGFLAGDLLLQRHLFNSFASPAQMPELLACVRAKRGALTLSWDIATWQTRSERAAAASGWASNRGFRISTEMTGEEARQNHGGRRVPLESKTRVSSLDANFLCSPSYAESRRAAAGAEEGKDGRERGARDERSERGGMLATRRDSAEVRRGRFSEFRDEDPFSDDFLRHNFFEAPDADSYRSIAMDGGHTRTQGDSGDRDETTLALQQTEKENELGPSAWRLLAAVKHRASAGASTRDPSARYTSASFSPSLLGSKRGESEEKRLSREERGAPRVSLQAVVAGHSRLTAARAFRDALLLHAKGFIGLDQSPTDYQMLNREEGRSQVFPPVYIHLKTETAENTTHAPLAPSTSARAGVPPPSFSDFPPDQGENSLGADACKKSASVGRTAAEGEELRVETCAVKEEREETEGAAERRGRRLARPAEVRRDAATGRRVFSGDRGASKEPSRACSSEHSGGGPAVEWKGNAERKERRERQVTCSVVRSGQLSNSFPGRPDVRHSGDFDASGAARVPRDMAVKREERKRPLKRELVRQHLLSESDEDIVVEIEAEDDLEACISESLKRGRQGSTPSVASTPRGEAGKRRTPRRPSSSFSSPSCGSLSPASASTGRQQERSSTLDGAAREARDLRPTAPASPTQQEREQKERDDENLVTDEQVEAAVETMLAQLLHGLNEQDRIHSGYLVDWYIEEHVGQRLLEEEATRRDSLAGQLDRERNSRFPCPRVACADVWRRRLHAALDTLIAEEVICGEEIVESIADDVHGETDGKGEGTSRSLPYRLYWLTGVAAIEALSQEEEG
ncbi:hypothetical protein NCLIV_068470 [Neospora caninum Liverpool]|uniref:Uncharacterized protein n=1 Tax=Neospora caninum (strain Liverpool) TaxID=572307 RepID=F0VRS5_NEOCL|nr:hypothetical protein NCLIV_068470 [Neospora caninum Liverpool]CBZ56423.1 hypothetical protein NCLIV_068470 [Neospora caninum Liverpool]CEL71182.1 TPA: hypothetical protein BN1204_068470 [Neospora caninum Liverpool]|eukprot:XP_003886448.1 hypothetical protein NCLIV_068470 [Neospora caninum Liverpool]